MSVPLRPGLLAWSWRQSDNAAHALVARRGCPLARYDYIIFISHVPYNASLPPGFAKAPALEHLLYNMHYDTVLYHDWVSGVDPCPPPISLHCTALHCGVFSKMRLHDKERTRAPPPPMQTRTLGVVR